MDMAEKEHAHGDHGHSDPILLYFGVFTALMLLTAITVWVASISFPNWSAGHVTVAMVVAVIKATLVIMIFMHAMHAGPLVRVIIVTSVLTLMILFGLTYADYSSRKVSAVGTEAEELQIK